jgi:superfamily II DNA or RNA helicase
MAIAPFPLSNQRVLILTPNVKLARDVADKLDVINAKHENVYKKFGILTEDDLEGIELYVLRLEGGADARDIDEHHLIVSNYHQLQDIGKWFAGKEDSIDLIIIDEAHHQAANTYKQILDFFPNAKVIGLTATPFRSDGRPLDGKFIYKYSFAQAIKDGVIRNLLASNIAPEQLELEFTDKDKKTYSLEEVLGLKEESWFRRGIATSQDCSDSIALRANEKLQQLRQDFPKESHQIIAAAMSKRHAREVVKPAFEKLGLRVGMVSSANEDKKTNDDTFAKLPQGKIDVIIHICMLGEGFDHPPLGVAAIFRPFATLNPYIQFIGRVVRKNGSTSHSYIVSHLGLNQLQRFDEFRLFDNDDKELLEDLMSGKKKFGSEGGDSTFVDPGDVTSAGASASELPKIREIGAQTMNFEAQFVAHDEVQNALSKFEDLDEKGKELFLKKLGIDPKKVSLNITKKDARVKPVEKRKASRNLLNEREKSIAVDVMKTLGVKHMGRDFNKLFDNFTWVKRKVSRLVNEKLGIKSDQRKTITNAMFEDMDRRGLLDAVKNDAVVYFKNKLK